MANSLQYASTQVAPYLVAVDGCLSQVSLDLPDFTIVKAENDGLRGMVLVLETEKRKFEGCYDLMDGEKAFAEEHVASLDAEVERLLQQVEGLEAEKEAFEKRVKLQISNWLWRARRGRFWRKIWHGSSRKVSYVWWIG